MTEIFVVGGILCIAGIGSKLIDWYFEKKRREYSSEMLRMVKEIEEVARRGAALAQMECERLKWLRQQREEQEKGGTAND